MNLGTNNKFKLKLNTGRILTGKILEENNEEIKIHTIKDEIIFLKKSEIRHAIYKGEEK